MLRLRTSPACCLLLCPSLHFPAQCKRTRCCSPSRASVCAPGLLHVLLLWSTPNLPGKLLFIHKTKPRFHLFCEAFLDFLSSPPHSWKWVSSASPTLLCWCICPWTCSAYCSGSWACLLHSGRWQSRVASSGENECSGESHLVWNPASGT